MLAATRSGSGKALQLTNAAAQRSVSMTQATLLSSSTSFTDAEGTRSVSSPQEGTQDKYMDKWRGLLTRRGLIGQSSVTVTNSAFDSTDSVSSPFQDASALSSALSLSSSITSPTSLLTMTLSEATTLMKLHTYGLLELDLGTSVRAAMCLDRTSSSSSQVTLSPRFSDPVVYRDASRAQDFDFVRSF